MLLRGVIVTFLLANTFAQTQPAFEVAAIKPTKDMTRRPSIASSPGGERFTARTMPLIWLIATAYNVSNRQISQLPDDLASRNFDIDAKCAVPSTRAQMMKMLQTLLVERFHLRIRREPKEMTASVLTIAMGGPKLEETTDGSDFEVRKISASKTIYHNVPMALFTNLLAGYVNGAIVDETGLEASYNFTLNFMPESLGPGVLEGREPGPDPSAPSLFTALQEQLGLRLITRKATVKLLVVEHIEALAEN